MRMLLTRPRLDSEALAGELATRGIDTLIAPVIEIVALPHEPPADVRYQAMLLTSGNAAAALSSLSLDKTVPVYCVGDATGQRLMALGFTDVRSAAGDVDDLAKLLCDGLDPDRGPLLHLTGALVAGDLAGALGAVGFAVERRVVYRAEAVGGLDGAAVAALRGNGLDGVLFYSPRSARILVGLLEAAGLVSAAAEMTAYCMSPPVAEAARKLVWRKVTVARRPNQLDLLALLPN